MIKKIQKTFRAAALVMLGSTVLWNCEPETDQLGSQFFQNGAKATETAYPLIAYTIDNHDVIRTDAARLQSATLGAFNEPQFGLQKSDYVTQMRLSVYNPELGTNPVLDSAVLVIKPLYIADSVTVSTNEDYKFPEGDVPAKKVVSTYPVVKYGKSKLSGKTLLNIKVEEVTEFLFSSADTVQSNRNVSTGMLLGAKTFDGTITSVKVTKDSDASVLFDQAAAIRIPMDSTFFQNKIIAKAKSPELADAASFIRYIKGIKVSVAENDGYIFNFDPNTVELNLYYKNDKTEGTTTTRNAAVYQMNLGNSNAQFSQIHTVRAGTPSATAIATSNEITGDAKVYAQGMGGPGVGIRIPTATIDEIKGLYQSKKIGIVSAKMRVYTDVERWNNSYKKPAQFVVGMRDLTPAAGQPQYLDNLLVDMTTFAYNSFYKLVKAYDLEKNPAYYDIGITQSLKDIIEKEAKNNDFVLNVGAYTVDETGAPIGLRYPEAGAQNFTTRSYTPTRVVLVGTDPSNERSAKLIITYGQKQ